MEQEVIDKFIKTHGKRANIVLSIAGKKQQLVNALETPQGKEIVAKLAEQVQSAIMKIKEIDVKQSDEEVGRELKQLRAEWDVGDSILNEFLNDINIYQKQLEKIATNKL